MGLELMLDARSSSRLSSMCHHAILLTLRPGMRFCSSGEVARDDYNDPISCEARGTVVPVLDWSGRVTSEDYLTPTPSDLVQGHERSSPPLAVTWASSPRRRRREYCVR